MAVNAPDVINVIIMLVQSIASLSKPKLTELLYYLATFK